MRKPSKRAGAVSDPLLQEAEELLEDMRHLVPLSQEEVCEWYGIELRDFPKLAIANLERELEKEHEMIRVFRGCRDRKSVELVRAVEARIAVVKRSIRHWEAMMAR